MFALALTEIVIFQTRDDLALKANAKRRRLIERARKGDASAQIALAKSYLRESTAESLVQSLPWFRRAAKQGDPQHQLAAGLNMYWSGLSKRLVREGFLWIERAAMQGDVRAQYTIAADFAIGATVRRNMKKAILWYRRAAKAGSAEAQYNLALMYYAGEGVTKNAVTYRRLLESAGRKQQIFALRRLYEASRDGSLGYPSSDTKARYWKRRYDREIERAGGDVRAD